MRPKKFRSGWEWTRERLCTLAEYIEEDMSCGAIATKMNVRYEEECPGLSLTKHSILDVFNTASTYALLVEEVGEERAKQLAELVHKPRKTGRPKGSKNKAPHTRRKRLQTRKVGGKAATVESILALRAKQKGPTQ